MSERLRATCAEPNERSTEIRGIYSSYSEKDLQLTRRAAATFLERLARGLALGELVHSVLRTVGASRTAHAGATARRRDREGAHEPRVVASAEPYVYSPGCIRITRSGKVSTHRF